LKRTNSPLDESAVADLHRSGQQSGDAAVIGSKRAVVDRVTNSLPARHRKTTKWQRIENQIQRRDDLCPV